MMKKTKVLYLSYDGIMEPIGQSQILPYILELSKKYSIYILTYEKFKDIKNYKLKLSIEKKLIDNNINWKFIVYKSNSFLSCLNIFKGFCISLYITFKYKIKFYHLRSYIPGLITFFLIILFRKKFIFDIRGFWIDEKADRLNLNKNSIKYILFKNIEKILMIKSSHIVTLTNESKNIIIKKFSNIRRNKISIIPTCVQTDNFSYNKKQSNKNKNIIFCYLGSIDTAYDFNKVLNLFNMYKDIDKKIFLKIVTNSKRKLVLKYIKHHGLNKNQFSIENCEHSEIHKLINSSNIGIFYAKNNFSIKASFPTRIGEFLSCGKPIICNNFNRDINYLINKNNLGIISNFEEKNSYVELTKIKQMLKNNSTRKRIINFVDKNLSLEIAIKKYLKIYNQL